ncbi:hypothetical protein BRO07_15740 [Xanthomonas oryzae pv. oryzae]|nr:hypothetical protein BRN26_20310 [Xanthomonas oryzae pv. oryzae]RBC23081.1 hypothetical protein BRN28_20095 [Xanthomonas oryzae pv. oryzae]RBH96664.1 hypothetical protein BRL98_22905 [Xanthomonas oryzae pv. oryzae]RBJ05023.1 hypothetical protein BRO01_16355 [Xanthomonas oryzae pv. oryzae]RBJ42877.1 hypothetical protein BRO07_15740 [Xanthomonas oryzae pv. oryzae]
MPPHSEQIVSRICGALFRGSLKAIHSYHPMTCKGSVIWKCIQNLSSSPRKLTSKWLVIITRASFA